MPYSGTAGIWLMKDNAFRATNYDGTAAGLASAISDIGSASFARIFVGPGVITGVNQIMPSGKRIVLEGAGAGLTKLVGTGGSASVISWTQTHQLSEWNCAVRGMTLDGNATTGDILLINGATLFKLGSDRDVVITNGAGTGSRLISLFDSDVDIYVENVGDSTHPFVVLDANGSGADAFNACRIRLHTEANDQDAVHLDIIGNATNAVEENEIKIKAHGNATSGNPNRPLVRIGTYGKANVIGPGVIAYGKGTSQIEVTGDRNRLIDLNFGIDATHPPANAIELIGGRNHVIRPNFKGTAYTNKYLKNSGQYCLLEYPQFGTGGPGLYADTGYLTAIWMDPGGGGTRLYDNRGLILQDISTMAPYQIALTDAATIAVNAASGGLFTVTLGGNRTMGAPTNPTQGKRITFEITQDGTGGRTLAWNAVFKTNWSDTGNTLNKVSTISFFYNGSIWRQDGAQSAYI